MEAIEKQRHGRGVADPKSDLVADRQGKHDVPPGDRRIGLPEPQCHRYRERVRMDDRLLVDVVHLKCVARRAVDEHCIG